eukprot:TRINITY_DN738_c0_g1_i7.p1 TRINITY_DN738_c0_g1~~TRINITY_DN738_c0_g1_i7.p1  ORF type:complete len:653 (+),score=159.39 TRINITY_DN738_c0_g1_i7:31-1959(+)
MGQNTSKSKIASVTELKLFLQQDKDRSREVWQQVVAQDQTTTRVTEIILELCKEHNVEVKKKKIVETFVRSLDLENNGCVTLEAFESALMLSESVSEEKAEAQQEKEKKKAEGRKRRKTTQLETAPNVKRNQLETCAQVKRRGARSKSVGRNADDAKKNKHARANSCDNEVKEHTIPVDTTRSEQLVYPTEEKERGGRERRLSFKKIHKPKRSPRPAGMPTGSIEGWSIDDVVAWATAIAGEEAAHILASQKIDGAALLELTRFDFERYNIPGGPSVKLEKSIHMENLKDSRNRSQHTNSAPLQELDSDPCQHHVTLNAPQLHHPSPGELPSYYNPSGAAVSPIDQQMRSHSPTSHAPSSVSPGDPHKHHTALSFSHGEVYKRHVAPSFSPGGDPHEHNHPSSVSHGEVYKHHVAPSFSPGGDPHEHNHPPSFSPGEPLTQPYHPAQYPHPVENKIHPSPSFPPSEPGPHPYHPSPHPTPSFPPSEPSPHPYHPSPHPLSGEQNKPHPPPSFPPSEPSGLVASPPCSPPGQGEAPSTPGPLPPPHGHNPFFARQHVQAGVVPPSPVTPMRPPPASYATKQITLQQYKEEDIQRDEMPLTKGTFGTVYTGRVPGRSEKVVIKDMHTVNEKSIAEWRKELLIMA